MKTSRDELLRETLVRYYWRLVCNGAKALADSARMHPMCKKYIDTRMMLDQDDGKNLPCHPF